MALHAEFRFGVRLFREPDAGNPPVRFDEREEETELSQTGLRRRGESPANCHREATVNAPLLDSTQTPPVQEMSGTMKRAEDQRAPLKTTSARRTYAMGSDLLKSFMRPKETRSYS